jgi:hypothetical protein
MLSRVVVSPMSLLKLVNATCRRWIFGRGGQASELTLAYRNSWPLTVHKGPARCSSTAEAEVEPAAGNVGTLAFYH